MGTPASLRSLSMERFSGEGDLRAGYGTDETSVASCTGSWLPGWRDCCQEL